MMNTAPWPQPDFTLELTGPRPKRRIWLAVALLALLVHLLLFWLHPSWLASPPPRRVEVTQVDPEKLEQIRKQWQNERQRQLLLNKDPSLPKSETAPPDARYDSDRNIRVEKEQRARRTDVLPRPAIPQKQPETHSGSRPLKLSQLGVPMNLGAPTDPRKTAPQQAARAADPPMPGRDQYVEDPTLPEGGENLLNAQESVYYSFYARLYESIGPIWQSRVRRVPYRRRVSEGTYTTQVDVIFDREGNLIGIQRLRDSGIPDFDQAVDESWRQIGRFPNPPQGLLNERGEVHTGWTFTVSVGSGLNLDYLPPERNY